MSGVAGGQGFEGTARADRAQLAEIADGNQLGPRGFYRPKQLGYVGIAAHGPFVQDQDMARA
jgi:hypothetical protein